MFTKRTKSKSKTRAQAMVEFALVLPILLLVVYGLLEAGRLLFIFASVNTASRQAARYGSAIGLVDTNGDGTLDTPHYEDCAGIRAAANNVAFIAPFTNINIAYDAGLKSDGTPNDIPGVESDPAISNACPASGLVDDGDRVNVYVSAIFSPIIPLVPLGPMTIESTASRTIVGEISIHVTAQPGSWIPSAGSPIQISLEITPSPTTYSYVGDTITYTYKITNIGSLDATGNFSITDSAFSLFPCWSGTLAPDEWTTCTHTYTITQADINNGSFTNEASAFVTGATSNTAQATVTFLPVPELTLLQIIPDPTEAFTAGQQINFYFTIENTGNAPLSSFSVVDGGMVSGFSCSAGTLQPGDTANCSGNYQITQANINNGSVDYVAGVQAGDGTLSNLETAFVLTSRLFLVEVTPNIGSVNSAGQVVQFTYTLQNRGSVNIDSIDSITGPYVQNVDCSTAVLPLAPNNTTTCISTYTVQQPDMDAGSTFTLDAVVNASTAGGGTLTSNRRTTSVTVIQKPVLTLSISADPNPALVLGTQVKYTYTLTNNGNVSLKGFTVTDNNITYGLSQSLTCADPSTLLAPGQSRACFPVLTDKVTRTLDDVDIANGSIKNEAIATGYYGPSNISIQSNLDAYLLITFNAPRVTLILTADPIVATVGEQVTFNFLVKNTGNADLAPFVLSKVGNTGPDLQLFGCTPTALGIGESQLCQATHIVSSDITATWQVTASPAPDPSVDSASVTVQASVGCDPRHTPLLTSPYSFTILNNGSTAITISQITVNWNNSNGNSIDSITLGGTTIWSGNENSNPATFNSFTGSAATRTIAASGNKQMIFIFKKTYVPFVPFSEWVQVSFAEPSCSGIILNTNNSGQLP